MRKRRSLDRAVGDYLEAVAVRGRSSATLVSYRSHLGLFVRWAIENRVRGVGHLHVRIVERYLEHLHDSGLHAKTQQTKRSCLRHWFEWMVDRDWLTESPMPRGRSRRVDAGLPRAVLSIAEVEAILDAIDIDRPAGLRDRA